MTPSICEQQQSTSDEIAEDVMAELPNGETQERLDGERGGRKRARVAEEDRKRASVACDCCRAVKEKCHGGFPCRRCTRLNKACNYSEASKVARRDDRITKPTDNRVPHMERIISHFLGDVSQDASHLKRIAEKLTQRPGPCVSSEELDDLAIGEEQFTVKSISSKTAHYSGEFSHWNFSQRIRRKIDEHSGQGNDEVSVGLKKDFMKDVIDREHWRATHLHQPKATTQAALTRLPPRAIADFLAQAFLKYGQVNHFFVPESWLMSKIQYCYDSPSAVSVEDAPWICSVLMTLAIGTQFAHMESSSHHNPWQRMLHNDENLAEDAIGVAFYREACTLVPDILIIASVESAQAFLLLAAYALPLDAQGLAYTYLGLSVKMCVQNGLHRRQVGSVLSLPELELRRRLWWSAYTLDRRVSILHGRPASVSHNDVDADSMEDLADFRSSGGPSKYQNMCAMVDLTARLADISHTINLLRRCPKALQTEYISRLLDIRDKTQQWWTNLPQRIVCRDLDPQGPLFRPNVHIKLGLHLNQVYMGRPFLFHQPKPSTPDAPHLAKSSSWSILARDCVDGALQIIELCQTLHDKTGLARASYIEFSSCRAALLAIIAQSLNEQSDRLRSALSTGLTLIRMMMVGNNSAKAEVSVIEALATATKRLTSASKETSDAVVQEAAAYDSFKTWAMSFSKPLQSSSGSPSQCFDQSFGQPDPFAGMNDMDLNELLASFPLEQGGFGQLSPFE